MTIHARITPYQKAAAVLATENDVPLQGERVRETDTGREKTGDGATHYNDLPYDDQVLKAAIGAYTKPGTGIPKADLATAVQTSLGKADSAYQAPAVVGAGADAAAARAAIDALHGIVVDSAGATSTTKRTRFVLDEFGEIDDILTEET